MTPQVHIGIDARMYSKSFTGIGRYTHELTKHLFVLRPEWHFTLFLAPQEYEAFDPPSLNVDKVLSPEKHYSFAEQTSFWTKISRQKFDLFHFPHFNAPLLYAGKTIVTIHDLTISFFPGKKKTSWLDKAGYKLVVSDIVKKSKKVIAVSENTKKDLQNILKAPEEKIAVVWNGLGAEFLREEQNVEQVKSLFGKLKKKHEIEYPYFLYTGVHREHKNVVGMIKAFEKFLKKRPNVQLVITGKEDPYYPEIREEIEKSSLQNNVKTVGLVSENELKTLFYHAHTFVFPSFYEGFGLPPLEAMAMEIPVVASNASSIPEICADAAEYFDPKNIDDIAEKMTKVFSDTKRRNELREKGKKRIQFFSWKRMAEETIKVYEEVLFPEAD